MGTANVLVLTKRPTPRSVFFSAEVRFLQRILKMRCSPESVLTTSESSPTFRAKDASSKAFCILSGQDFMLEALLKAS